MEQATVEEAKQRIRKHRQPNDYSLSDPPEDAEAAATDATQMQQMQQRARPTREGTSAYVRRIRQHTSAYATTRRPYETRQHTSAYVSIRRVGYNAEAFNCVPCTNNHILFNGYALNRAQIEYKVFMF